jgi:hypothetical protein
MRRTLCRSPVSGFLGAESRVRKDGKFLGLAPSPFENKELGTAIALFGHTWQYLAR